ncbi:Asparagine synthase (Glutamine-hydrolysing) 1 (modular protein) [uncultured delta proteobacterium]|uniref:asparagine synthase (glutamine-hydrolyzing) n=1 Tax=uncultured delta proteobacterium TaxID=34034 RepID=A0A212KH38_9DELT|nr:Asparagine synthase (Glutamine-hydrolysing) 1 (modular protein) [uncultured delta proteobacterium]
MRRPVGRSLGGGVMCGIAGWYGWDMEEVERLPRLCAMCDTIRHRGPDDDGFFTTSKVALGMRRLAIVDIEGGRQPMRSEDGSVTLVFNGEIYNHRELRRELEQQGVRFKTAHSDTEVLLAMYLRHGLDLLPRLNGMFGIAVWDARERALHLMRDRLGVKPLYYYHDGKRLLFASEIKAVLAANAFTPEVNPKAVWDYLTFRYVPAPETIWQNVYKLPPGHSLTIREGEAEPEVVRWWDIPYRFPSREIRLEDADAEFDALLNDAVDLRMVADVPVGILLSGGLDSSTVAALAARHATRPIKTFSVAFEDAPGIDERPFAREVAAHLHTEHAEVVIGKKDFQSFLEDFVYYTDEPLADLASVPLWHVCRLAHEEVKVVLSGEGSDEILGGYDFELYARDWLEKEKPRSGMRGLWDRLYGRDPVDMRTWNAPFTMTNYLSSETKRSLMRQGPYPDSLQPLRERLAALGRQDPLHQTLYCFSQDWLTEDLLMKADRMSMAVSLELRTPFLDYRLVEWAAAIPAAYKAGPDQDGVWKSKLILRRIAEKLLPQSILARPKQGFPVPVYEWLSGNMADFVRDMLGSRQTRVTTWLQETGIRKTVSTGVAPDAHILDKHRLWNLLILECWARRWQA